MTVNRVGILTVMLLLGWSASAQADQCAVLTSGQVEAAKRLLQVGRTYFEWCEPCKQARPTYEQGRQVEKVIVQPWGVNTGKLQLFLNGRHADLAYHYVDVGGAQYDNLAMLVGCPATGVQRRISFGAPAAAAPACNPVQPTKSWEYSAARGHICNPDRLTASDGNAVGLDYNYAGGLDNFGGKPVSGCVIMDFPMAPTQTLDSVTLRARPSPSACGRSPCKAPYCGAGQQVHVFVKNQQEQWRPGPTITMSHPTWAQYRVPIKERAPRLVMMCRSGAGPERDDVLIDSVSGCMH